MFGRRPAEYVVCDVLQRDGRDTRPFSLRRRKLALQRLKNTSAAAMIASTRRRALAHHGTSCGNTLPFRFFAECEGFFDVLRRDLCRHARELFSQSANEQQQRLMFGPVSRRKEGGDVDISCGAARGNISFVEDEDASRSVILH